MNAVYSTSLKNISRCFQACLPRVLYDLKKKHAYWEQFSSSFGEISQKVNDAYLKANAQAGGVATYGKVVDLMVADFKINKEQVQQNPERSVYIGEGTH